MLPPQVEALFQTLERAFPDPQTELFYTNTYTLLVAVVLSARMTDAGVNKVTPALFTQVSTPRDMVALGEERLKQAIRSVGLYPTKARRIIELSHLLITQHGEEVPRTREELEALPGVGRKTANVVLNVAFGEAVMPVDTHVFRVAKRTGLATGSTPLAVEKQLMACMPPTYAVTAHHLLILHGRHTCKARKPACQRCVIAPFCTYMQKQVSQLP